MTETDLEAADRNRINAAAASRRMKEMLDRIAVLETALTAGFDQLAKRAMSEEDQVILRLMHTAMRGPGATESEMTP